MNTRPSHSMPTSKPFFKPAPNPGSQQAIKEMHSKAHFNMRKSGMINLQTFNHETMKDRCEDASMRASDDTRLTELFNINFSNGELRFILPDSDTMSRELMDQDGSVIFLRSYRKKDGSYYETK